MLETVKQLLMEHWAGKPAMALTAPDGALEYVNPAFERLSGWMREEIVGRHTRILKSGRHPASFYRELWETVLRGDVWRGRMTNRRRDGTLFEEEETITPVRDTSGRTTHFVCVRREVGGTERNGTEPAREESQALAPIVSSLAGELNNHLSTVNLSLALLRRTFPFPPDNSAGCPAFWGGHPAEL